jgi:hypothetical protein
MSYRRVISSITHFSKNTQGSEEQKIEYGSLALLRIVSVRSLPRGGQSLIFDFPGISQYEVGGTAKRALEGQDAVFDRARRSI